MVEVFSGLLTGLGYGLDPKGRHNDGVFLLGIPVRLFRDPVEFAEHVSEFIDYLKATPLAEGHSVIYYPGELEVIARRRAMAEGVELPEATVAELEELATSA